MNLSALPPRFRIEVNSEEEYKLALDFLYSLGASWSSDTGISWRRFKELHAKCLGYAINESNAITWNAECMKNNIRLFPSIPYISVTDENTIP